MIKTLIDFPDYSHANPWQIKTIETCAPFDILRTLDFSLSTCTFFHISWEDCLLHNCKTYQEGLKRVEQVEEILKAQAKISKIAWTLHNENSHSKIDKNCELQLREVIMEHASIIFLMSAKHLFKIPVKYKHKVKILPHYIEENPLKKVDKLRDPCFLKFGANRGDKFSSVYENILNNDLIFKFVSDVNVNKEILNYSNTIIKRRFTIHELNLYSRFANFSLFLRNSNFNSGIINFLIGNYIAVYHDVESVKFMDIPEVLKKFQINNIDLKFEFYHDDIINTKEYKKEIENFIMERSPLKVSTAFWNSVLSC